MPKQMMAVIRSRYDRRNKQSPYVFCADEGEPFRKDQVWVRGMMDRLCKKAGVKRFTFHALRHRIAAILEDSGEASLCLIQNFLGHKRPTTTSEYLKTLDRGATDLANIIDALDEQEDRPKQEGRPSASVKRFKSS